MKKEKKLISISSGNEKMGDIPNISLPPIITCRPNTPCKKGCYATKGTSNYDNVKKSRAGNLAAFISDKEAYFNEIIKYVDSKLTIHKFFRWHVAGDIVNSDYLEGMIRVAKTCKRTKFLAFTKKFELVNDFLANVGELPRNLKIVFSAWDKNFEVVNPYHLPVAYVDFSKKDRNPCMPEFVFPCSNNCEECLYCWQLKKRMSVKFNEH